MGVQPISGMVTMERVLVLLLACTNSSRPVTVRSLSPSGTFMKNQSLARLETSIFQL